jgi:hypothetical protein
MLELTADHIARFNRDGFLILDRIIEPDEARRVASRFEDLFAGRFETGVQPDEWNWREGRDSPDLTRQICNAWKSDHSVARVAFRADIGRACAQLGGWDGARLELDNAIWKPPGARPLGFHQDSAYLHWLRPNDQVSCWIALDQTTAEGGTLLHVRGSKDWGLGSPIRQFHGPRDYMREMQEAAQSIGQTPEVVPVVVPVGGGAFHHGWTWHGSADNRSGKPRRSLVVHTIRAEARYDPAHLGQGIGPTYGRYRKFGSDVLDEYYFPILWTRDGGRSHWLDTYMSTGSAAAA